jgi:hypothetical protein
MLVPGEDTHADLDGGWVLPAPEPRQAVHTRSILCRSFRRDDGLIDIDGRFIDTRPFAYDNHFRGACEAGSALHNMQLRLTVDRARLVTQVQVAMVSTPYTSCPGVLPNFQRLVGLSLARGFKRALREKLGGIEGCTHILALLEAMAAAAVQSFASNAYAPRRPGEAEPVRIWRVEELVDTCWSYQADGAVMQQMQQLQKARQRG